MKSKNEKAKLIQNIYDLTPLQEGMLFHHLYNNESTGYIIQECYDVNSEMNLEFLDKALMLLSMKHDALRTAIMYEKMKAPKQVVFKERKIELSVEDLSGKNEDEQDKFTEQILASDLKRGIDLQKDSLMRLKYINLGGKSTLLFTSHHIIIDGWCSNTVTAEFLDFYLKLNDGMPFDSLKKAIIDERAHNCEYVDYINWLKKQSKSKGMEYWKNLLADYDNIAEIKPMQKPEHSDEQVKNMEIIIPEKYVTKLLDIIKNTGSTINTAAEVIWGLTLQSYMREKDVVFGKVVSGRNADIDGIENIVGLFVNTIPVRINVNENDTFSNLLKNQQIQGTNSSEYDFLSLSDVQNFTEQKSELIKTLFVFQNYFSGAEPEKDEIDSDESGFGFKLRTMREQTEYPITVQSACFGNVFLFEIKYDPNIYVESEIKLILDRILKISEEVADNPDVPFNKLEKVTEKEKELILNDFNATETEYPRDKTVVELFEEQVAKTPDKIALVIEDEKLTYSEFNARANSLAHKLREIGVKPDDFVAIIADRSIEMIAGIYGIIKAGGAYVPIDPTY
ncbi:MAG: condensation domain-containing protein, partial [Ruminococcus sp.]|nr:condensation domain-containing protein [Ruminococcus sp.]